MIRTPQVGMHCRLNAKGRTSIGGIRGDDQWEQCQHMVITKVERIPCTDAVLYSIRVKGSPAIDKFMLTNEDVT